MLGDVSLVLLLAVMVVLAVDGGGVYAWRGTLLRPCLRLGDGLPLGDDFGVNAANCAAFPLGAGGGGLDALEFALFLLLHPP